MIKDWKKEKSTKREMVWKNKHKKEWVEVYHHYGLDVWFISVIEGNRETEQRRHKTKSEALKDAKNHMRRN